MNNLKMINNDNVPVTTDDVQFWKILYDYDNPEEPATQFIEALTGNPDTRLFWQSFKDTDKLGEAQKVYRNVPYSEVIKACKRSNENGHGIFIAVNQIDGNERKQKYVAKFRAAFMDVDGKGGYTPLDKLVLPIKPTIITARDADHYHIYFALKGEVTLEQWTALQRCLIRRYHSDKAMTDSARVLRVPGYQHLKDPDNPMMYYLIQGEKEVRYTFDELAKALGVEAEDYKPCYEKSDNSGIDYEENQPIAVRNFSKKCKSTPPGIQGERGDEHAYKLAAWGAERGLTCDVMLGIMLSDYNDRCDPPWSYSQLAEKVKNGYNYAQNRGGKTPEVMLADVEVPETPLKKIESVSFLDFAAKKLTDRECLIDPWLPSQGITMLYAERGVGKTYLALNIAYALACGKDFLNWSIPKPRNVLYIDGEMPASDLQQRIRTLIPQYPKPKAKIELIAHDLLRDTTLNIARPEDQEQLRELKLLEGMDLIVVDNISTLCTTGKENEAESWTAIQKWALEQRRERRSVLFIHHANKTGGQRGTSRREDTLDTIIKLEHPSDYEPSQGATFELHFEKNRTFCGDKANPTLVTLSMLPLPEDKDSEKVCFVQKWTVTPLEEKRKDRARRYYDEGWSKKEIAKELKVNERTVRKYLVGYEKAKGVVIKDVD